MLLGRVWDYDMPVIDGVPMIDLTEEKVAQLLELLKYHKVKTVLEMAYAMGWCDAAGRAS